jgi:hypothetical protein
MKRPQRLKLERPLPPLGPSQSALAHPDREPTLRPRAATSHRARTSWSHLLGLASLSMASSFTMDWTPARANSPLDNPAIYWPRQDLVIPFQVDLTGQPPAEIHLEVSEDRGRNWAVYHRSDVRGRQFNFQAARDGEYWFRLKTLDRFGAPIDNPGEPMHIVIDTTKPTGELLIDMDTQGDLQGEFRLLDTALDTTSIRMEFQTDTASQWEEVRCELEPGVAPGEWVGFGKWSIPVAAAQLIVRVTARDQAGNTIELTRMPRLPRSAANPTSVKLASNKAGEDASSPIGSGLARRFPTQRSLADSSSRSNPLSSTSAPLSSPPAVNGTPGQYGIAGQYGSPASMHPTAPIYPQSALVELLPDAGANPPSSFGAPTIGGAAPQRETLVSTTGLPLRSVDAPMPPSHESSLNAAPITFPPSDNLAGPPAIMTAASPFLAKEPKSLLPERAASSPSALPSMKPSLELGGFPNSATPSSQLQLSASPTLTPLPSSPSRPTVNALSCSSKAFSLDYTIDNDPGAPISSVELWGTTDSGRSWDRWGIDSDRESPFDIEVETEGLFGFRMVIVGSNGLASRRPLPGDEADSWIQVDTTQPRVQLISALNGKGPDAGSLVIEFQALDDHFTDRPISISYSETPKGPWIPITQGARNSGRFVWPAEPQLPEKVFLRLEAIDAAGNVGAHQMDLPVDVQSAAPRGRIQGIRPSN